VTGIRFEETAIPGLLIIHPHVSRDERGSFAKTFVAETFADAGLATSFAEEYLTSSKCGVIRGMHFQLPPHDPDKIVSCTNGRVFDVVLDLRVGSPTYGSVASFELFGPNGNALYVPAGCAHGFCSLSDDAAMVYMVTTDYSPACDAGVLWSSVPVEWPIADPIVSQRDTAFPALADFDSPFVFAGGDL